MRTKQYNWRRFRPREWQERAARPRRVEDILDDVLRNMPRRRIRPFDVHSLDSSIEHMKRRVETALDKDKAVYLKALLVLQTPRAASAQDEMDAHEHGYHNRTKRLYELIDFNDTFVNTVLASPQEELVHLTEHMKHQMLVFCRQLKAPMFSDEQFEAIVHGLSREIAVYLGAKQEGFQAEMTSRSQDAFGIDMVITDPKRQRTVNIDCKTPSAYRHRLGELIREGRLDEGDFDYYEQRDFVEMVNRKNDTEIHVSIVCIRPERLGTITNFQFMDTKPLAKLLSEVLQS